MINPFPRLTNIGHIARVLKIKPREALFLRLAEVWALSLAGHDLEEVLGA